MMKKTLFDGLIKRAKNEMESWEPNRVAPISPTPIDLIELVMSDANISSNSRVIDLGCGDGRWLCHIAERHKCNCWGIDMDVDRITIATQRVKENFLSSFVDLVLGDFSILHLSYFTTVIVYLSRVGHEKLKQQLSSQCLVDTIVVSIGFRIVGWSPVATYRSPSQGLMAYKYIIPEGGPNQVTK